MQKNMEKKKTPLVKSFTSGAKRKKTGANGKKLPRAPVWVQVSSISSMTCTVNQSPSAEISTQP